jgi:hypothetical protein
LITVGQSIDESVIHSNDVSKLGDAFSSEANLEWVISIGCVQQVVHGMFKLGDLTGTVVVRIGNSHDGGWKSGHGEQKEG